MIHLLTINLTKDLESRVLSILKAQNFEIDHLNLTKNEARQSILDNSFWDFVVLSEDTSQNFDLLSIVASDFSEVPIFFLTDAPSEELYNQVIRVGATDCFSQSQLFRLPNILRRELSQNDSSFKKSVMNEIIDLSTNEVLLFDAQTLKCCYANKTAIQNLGYSKEELYQLSPSKLYVAYSSEAFSHFITPLLSGQRNDIRVCTNIQRKTGTIYPSDIHLKKISYNSDFLLAIHTDISSYWNKVINLERQRKTAETFIQKHKQKEELLANAAHDMRTSLESIILSNRLLFDKRNSIPEEYTKYQKAIHFSGKHLLNYINEFFDPNGDAPDLSSDFMSVESFSQKLYLVFNPIAKRNDIEFHFDTSALQHDSITTNQTYVKRILKNLLSNAFKFTNAGSVTFEVYSVSKAQIQDVDFDFDNAIAFKVRDTGIGIPGDQQEKIFERHQRTAQHKKGAGLGLHISKKLTDAIGGTLKVYSTMGEGSTFILYLPIEQEPAEKPTLNEFTVSNPKSEKKHDKSILIIDDSEVHNLALREYLNYTFDECLVANTPQEAYKILEEHLIDCIVTDFTLKEDNCLEFLKTMQQDETYASIPTIVYTGKKLTEQEYSAITYHADSLVKKNAGSYDRLVGAIIACLEDNSPKNNTSLNN